MGLWSRLARDIEIVFPAEKGSNQRLILSLYYSDMTRIGRNLHSFKEGDLRDVAGVRLAMFSRAWRIISRRCSGVNRDMMLFSLWNSMPQNHRHHH
jgi:hypothetical protein